MPSPKQFAASLAELARRRRLRTWWLWGGASMVVLVVALLVWLFYFSQVFASEETVVEGNRLLTADQVLAAAEVPMGVPLARLDVAAPAARVEALEEVRNATVSTDFPNTVRIAVEERVAVYQMAVGSEYGWVDRDGVVFRKGQAKDEAMPVATIADPNERLRRDVATVLAALPGEVEAQVEAVQAVSVDRIVLDLGERTVVWGSADESALKGEVVAALLSVEAKVYDVSAPNNPTTR